MESARTAEARQIIGQYLQTLGTVSHLLAFGVPDTLLTHKSDEIRQAIRDCAAAAGADGAAPSNLGLAELRIAYQSLASFLPYEEANAAARLHHAFERGDYTFLASPAAELAMNRSRRIERESSELAREFDALVSGPADPVLSEVDAFLNEFDRKLTSLSG
jgi:hypothetical protein